MTEQFLFCKGWRFAELAPDTPQEVALNTKGRAVDIPHDFLIWDAQNLYRDADGWYFVSVPLAPAPQRTFLRFDGVYMDSTIFVNGQPVMEWKYGYTAFECEISRFAQGSSCEVAVRVRHRSPNSRWYSGAGIFRDVVLLTRPESYIASDSLYAVSSPQAEGTWLVEASAHQEQGEDGQWRFTLMDAQGEVVAQSPYGPSSAQIRLDNARVWDVEDPYLYRLRAELYVNGELYDAQEQSLGLRSIGLEPDSGLYLNGRHLKIHGVCQHHDLGALGAAFHEAAAQRQLDTLRAMGVNAIRTAHNPPADKWLDLCDKMGMLVMSEAFDMWEDAKNPYDYARFFSDWHERDVASWVRRDRRHPSVIFWSIGNEVTDVRAPRGIEVTRMLRDLVRQHDPGRHALVTMGSNHMSDEYAQQCADLLDCAGYNYAERLYEGHRAKYPAWNIYGSETSSALQSRGIYHFPLKQSILADDDLQCSSLGNCAASWGAKNAETCILQDRDAKHSLGMFVWSGTDYIGEPTPYHTRNSYFGQIDTAGFEKDSFYLYQAAWTKEPMVHIIPHWDWNEGQLIDVRVCSNQPVIRLYLNDSLIGQQQIDLEGGKALYADWQLPFAPGTLRAEALDDSGQVVASHSRSSFGDAVRLVLRPNKTSLKADGRDMVFVEITAEDAQGRVVDNALDRIQFDVSGAGRLLGLDNGDSASRDEYKGTSRRLFSGRLLAMVMATTEPGEVCLQAQAVGLGQASLQLISTAVLDIQGVSALDACVQSPADEEVPVRKAELSVQGFRLLTPQSPECVVRCKLLPAHHSYPEVVWRATGVAGVDSAAVELQVQGDECRVKGISDATVYLRCMAYNGSDHPEIISMLEIETRGFGLGSIDPYQFVSAGMYTLSEGEVASGNDRGVSIPPTMTGVFGFEGLDFGADGSDTITIPVFALTDGPCLLKLWDGLPGQGGRWIADLSYHKKMIWNTYQEETWVLPRRLSGQMSLCISSANRIHVKGFRFEKQERAFGRIMAAQAQGIWGDRFVKEDEWVRRIGNNVTLRYEGLRFGEGAGLIKVSAISRGRNAIELLFEPLEGEDVRMTLPLADSATESESSFALRGIRGEGTLSLMFLPGSDVDLHWFECQKETSNEL